SPTPGAEPANGTAPDDATTEDPDSTDVEGSDATTEDPDGTDTEDIDPEGADTDGTTAEDTDTDSTSVEQEEIELSNDLQPYVLVIGGRATEMPRVTGAAEITSTSGERNVVIITADQRVLVREGARWVPAQDSGSEVMVPAR
ncbi:MAG: hypothetical protein Q4G67_12545, partial [Actinomycetia bacterium]|nr:hypothetical protein [Actinomycetes bacterium]